MMQPIVATVVNIALPDLLWVFRLFLIHRNSLSLPLVARKYDAIYLLIPPDPLRTQMALCIFLRVPSGLVEILRKGTAFISFLQYPSLNRYAKTVAFSICAWHSRARTSAHPDTF